MEGREERYQFTWPDKKKAMLAANAPITATLRPVVTDSVGKDGTPGGFDSENLYIEGDNLEVLKLLQETYLGKVKMIYIDPPYNTGNDFVYEDDFAQSAAYYMDNSGQYDEEGNRLVTNTESNGRFHTDWLNMIYPRLKIAKDMLADDGSIFVSIDDNELNNVLNICNTIFGESNFVGCITWFKKASPSNDAQFFSNDCEYILVYARIKAFGDQTDSLFLKSRYLNIIPIRIMTLVVHGILQRTPVIKVVRKDRSYIIPLQIHLLENRFTQKKRRFGRIRSNNVRSI